MTDTRHNYDVDLVRERTDLLSLISQHVVLKKRGGRHVGLCPFHQEKTPSFGVDPQKGFWHCFGCGKGGDAFTFVMQLEGLTFPEALEKLAERAGIRPTGVVESPRRKEERDFLYEVNAAAADAFAKALRGKAGAAARDYLERRGITAEHCARFGLGYAPLGWDALVNHLRGRGFAIEMLVKAGLALPRSRGDGHIDRFRNRLMIPIHDRQGRVVAFGGRALSAEDQPKYLNTAETPIFQKSRTLYALHLAKEQITKRERAIVTEGYFDAIACHLAGFTEAVATLGTALGEDHVQVLRRLAPEGIVYLVFDADSAGVNAALRSQALFRAAGVDVRIVRLPTGHDPDTLLREGGAEAFERCLAEALSPVEFELDQLITQHPARDVESRVRLFRAAAQVLQPLPALERAEYAARLVERWFGSGHGDITQLQQAIMSEVAALDRSGRRRTVVHAEEAPPPVDDEMPAHIPEVPLEREALTMMVQDAGFAQRAVTAIPPEAFSHPGYRAVFMAMRKLADQGGVVDAARVVSDDERVASLVASLAVSETLPIEGAAMDSLLERLREAYETRRDQQPPAFDDPDELRAWTMRLRERSERAARRIFGEEK